MQDALKIAVDCGDRPTQAYCLCCQGDIFRQKNEYDVSSFFSIAFNYSYSGALLWNFDSLSGFLIC